MSMEKLNTVFTQAVLSIIALLGISASLKINAIVTITSPANHAHVDYSGSITVNWSSDCSVNTIEPYVNGLLATCGGSNCGSGFSGSFTLDPSDTQFTECVNSIQIREFCTLQNPRSNIILVHDINNPYSKCEGTPTSCKGGSSAASPQAGGPVDIATGKMYYETEDLRIDGPLPLAFSRRYVHSNAAVGGPLGFGWTYSFNMSVTPLTVFDMGGNPRIGGYSFFNDEGRNIRFPRIVVAPGIVASSRDHLTLTASSGYQIVNKSQTKWTFDSAGKLIEIRDRNNNTLTLAYDGSNRLSTVTDLFGRMFTLTYDPSNRVHFLDDNTAGTPRRVTYDYNTTTGNLQTVTDAAGKVWTYAYTNATYTHDLTSITDPLGHVVEAFAYTAGDQVYTFQKDSGNELLTFTYTSATSTTVTNSVGAVTTATLDQYNGVATAVTGPGCTECGSGNNVSYTLDADFNKKTVIDGNGNTTTRTFDANGNVLTLTEPLRPLPAITFTYNAFNFVTSRTEASVDPPITGNRSETWGYNATGDMTLVKFRHSLRV